MSSPISDIMDGHGYTISGCLDFRVGPRSLTSAGV